MSKKKAFSGSTMTLKDFHGGSIPSDLPLPSAPGVIVRPSDRSPFDRQIPTPPWGSSSIVRSDHRSRPGSSGPTRTFDEKASFLSVPHIGRNFDEDERKPFDGGVTRRPASDDSVRDPLIARPDPKPVAARQVSTAPVVHSQPPAVVKLAAGPNAWASRREAVEPAPPAVAAAAAAGTASAWSGPSAVSKFAQASAVEKISSGRWQSKPAQVYHQPPDVEVIRFVEAETETHVRFGNSQIDGRIELDVARGKYGDRDMSPKYPEAKEKGPAFYSDGARPASTEGKLGGGSQSQAVMEASERPKLKLLPRTRPMDPSEAHVVDYDKQGYQPPVADSGHVESVNEFFGNVNPPKPGSAGGDGANRAVERPKLNLKPRSQPREKSDGSAERERNTLFGGARPRELVLKERGFDDVVFNNLDMSQPANRAKHDSPKPDSKPEPSLPNTRYSEKPENFQPDQRTARDFERKDHRPDAEKTDMQWSSRRNDNRRNGKEIEKPQERRPEPESWRKPIEPPKQHMSDAQGPRFGRATSALELAQAFSRSMSDDGKSTDRFTSQRSLPGRNQVPFSRLTDTREFYSGPATRQINGY